MESRSTDSSLTPLGIDPEFEFVYVDDESKDAETKEVTIVVEEVADGKSKTISN